MDTPEQKPTRRKDSRPDEIVDAAMEVFSEDGFSKSKIIDIARKAGAAKGTVYLYFDTKDDLFVAVVRKFVRPFVGRIDDYIDSFEGSSRELLSGVILRAYNYLADSVSRRAILRILISEGHRFPKLVEMYHNEIICSAAKMLRRVIERGVESGEFRKTTVTDFPQVIVGPIIMAAIWKMTFEKVNSLDLEKLSNAHLDLLFDGLAVKD